MTEANSYDGDDLAGDLAAMESIASEIVRIMLSLRTIEEKAHELSYRGVSGEKRGRYHNHFGWVSCSADGAIGQLAVGIKWARYLMRAWGGDMAIFAPLDVKEPTSA